MPDARNLSRQLPERREIAAADGAPQHVWAHDPSLAHSPEAAAAKHDEQTYRVEWLRASQLARRGTERLLEQAVPQEVKARRALVRALRESPARLRDALDRRAAQVNATQEPGMQYELSERGIRRS